MFLTVPWTFIDAKPNSWNLHTERLVGQRLESMPLLFPVLDKKQVLVQVRRFLVSGHRETEFILGRAEHFFPIFDQQLVQAGLPKELKYLTIIESAVRPNAISHVGAKGMWQMMSPTARYYGLRVNGQLDERLDIYKSTEAAVRMLSDLYARFGDWSLVLAAYNCGPGRVLRAIKTANSSQYSAISHLLPHETQQYIFRFTAAAYVVKYYGDHHVQPVAVNPIWNNTSLWVTPKEMSFKKITEVTGLSYVHLSRLNPGATSGVWPTTSKGNFIILPKDAVQKMKSHIAKHEPRVQFVTKRLGDIYFSYQVTAVDNLESIAKQFRIRPEDLMRWNFLPNGKVFTYQHLNLYLPPSSYTNRA